MINEITRSLRSDLVLVLDDYHVIESQAIDQALTFLLDHLPPPPGGLHLVIASRTDPTLPLSRLRARGQLTELRAADLRFTTDEVAAFLEQVVRLPISSDDVRTLEERTEGWITGLQLAAVAMQGLEQRRADRGLCPQLWRQPSLRHRLSGGRGARSTDAQSPGVSVADLDPRPVDRSSVRCGRRAEKTAQTVLEQLEAANLFLIPLDGERRWYRYHHLFADLLRQRLRQTQPEQAPTLHRRASEWYALHGFQLEAVHHALAGGDLRERPSLIEATGLSLIGQGAFTTVRNWIDTLPERFGTKTALLVCVPRLDVEFHPPVGCHRALPAGCAARSAGTGSAGR